MKYVPPSIRETAFNCPHCGALTTQFWYSIRADASKEEYPLPAFIDKATRQEMSYEHVPDDEMRTDLERWADKMAAGRPFFDKGKDGEYSFQHLYNVNVSKCFNCKDVAVWIYDKLVYPQRGEAPPANPDLPNDIRQDYNEASSILDLSPRGAAALIRLCIQKLCRHLGETGENLNADIGALVRKGLDPRIQKALDAIRVTGNHAVHPGQISLDDDKATAESLFRLLNVIAEKMVSEPKHVDEVYEGLPPGARAAIEKRDGKK